MEELEDEIDFLQYGQQDTGTFYHVIDNVPSPSSWRDDLSTNPDGRYKFASAEINLNQDVLKVS